MSTTCGHTASYSNLETFEKDKIDSQTNIKSTLVVV